MNIKSEKIKALIQFISYVLVGSTNFIIDLIVLNILWASTGIRSGNINYFFKLISFSIYSTTGYILNKNFTFNSSKPKIKSSYLEYVSTLGLLSLIDAIILSKFTLLNIWGVNQTLWANIVNICSCATTGILGFLINKYIIFNSKKDSSSN